MYVYVYVYVCRYETFLKHDNGPRGRNFEDIAIKVEYDAKIRWKGEGWNKKTK